MSDIGTFDHTAAREQIAGSIAYAGTACSLGGVPVRAMVRGADADGYPVEQGESPVGYLLTVARSMFGSTIPAVDAPAVVDGRACRVIRPPHHSAASATLEYFVLPKEVLA